MRPEDIELNEKWCRNFVRVLLARARRDHPDDYVYLIPGTGEAYQIERLPEGEDPRGWKVRLLVPDEAKATAYVERAEKAGVFHILHTNILRLEISGHHVNASAFLHGILATMEADTQANLTVTVTADEIASRSNRWCLEHNRVSEAKKRSWWAFTDTRNDEWVIKWTPIVKELTKELAPAVPFNVGEQARNNASFATKTQMEVRDNTQQQIERRAGGLPPGGETR
jgi:hypothetical protein